MWLASGLLWWVVTHNSVVSWLTTQLTRTSVVSWLTMSWLTTHVTWVSQLWCHNSVWLATQLWDHSHVTRNSCLATLMWLTSHLMWWVVTHNSVVSQLWDSCELCCDNWVVRLMWLMWHELWVNNTTRMSLTTELSQHNSHELSQHNSHESHNWVVSQLWDSCELCVDSQLMSHESHNSVVTTRCDSQLSCETWVVSCETLSCLMSHGSHNWVVSCLMSHGSHKSCELCWDNSCDSESSHSCELCWDNSCDSELSHSCELCWDNSCDSELSHSCELCWDNSWDSELSHVSWISQLSSDEMRYASHQLSCHRDALWQLRVSQLSCELTHNPCHMRLTRFTSDCAPFHLREVVCAVRYLHEGCVSVYLYVCVSVCVCGVRSFLIWFTNDCGPFHLREVVCAVRYLHEGCVSVYLGVCVCVCLWREVFFDFIHKWLCPISCAQSCVRCRLFARGVCILCICVCESVCVWREVFFDFSHRWLWPISFAQRCVRGRLFAREVCICVCVCVCVFGVRSFLIWFTDDCGPFHVDVCVCVGVCVFVAWGLFWFHSQMTVAHFVCTKSCALSAICTRGVYFVYLVCILCCVYQHKDTYDICVSTSIHIVQHYVSRESILIVHNVYSYCAHYE